MRLRAELCHAKCAHLKVICGLSNRKDVGQLQKMDSIKMLFLQLCNHHLYTFANFSGSGGSWFPIYHPCGIFCQPSDSVLLAHKSSFIISLESEAETIWILGVSRLRSLI